MWAMGQTAGPPCGYWNGAFVEATPQMEKYAVSLKSVAVALAGAARYKRMGLLAQRLKGEGVYVDTASGTIISTIK